jgi:hypothetical protein
MVRRAGVLALMALLACADTETGPVPLGPAARLARASLDLRGRRPSEEELDGVEADPDSFATRVHAYVDAPEFGERVVARYAELYRTRSDVFVVGVDGSADFLDDPTRMRFTRSVGEEPLRLLARVATDDLPWTTIVTADWTMADEGLLRHFPLQEEEAGEGWRRARYTDGRPPAGVLSTNGLWWRYTSTLENVNRGRAQAITELLLCDDRFVQPIAFRVSTDVYDTEALGERVREDDACVACHAVLDPLGSFLYGFYRNHPESYNEALAYQPGREGLWRERTRVPPSYYGQPGATLWDLGQYIAADPRFPTCAVQQAFSFLRGRAPGLDDTPALDAAREVFLAQDLRLRPLYETLVNDPAYGSNDEARGGRGPRRLGPDLLASSVEALTGYRWRWEGVDVMTTDEVGVRVLHGGADGTLVTDPSPDHATTSLLVEQRLAEAAAAWVVADEPRRAVEARILFRELDPSQDHDAALRAAQVRALVRRILSRAVPDDDPDVAGLLALWEARRASGASPAESWTSVVTALLRHPDFVAY